MNANGLINYITRQLMNIGIGTLKRRMNAAAKKQMAGTKTGATKTAAKPTAAQKKANDDMRAAVKRARQAARLNRR